MNASHWLTEGLTQDKAAQQAKTELPQQSRHLLAQLRAELRDLSMKAQVATPKVR